MPVFPLQTCSWLRNRLRTGSIVGLALVLLAGCDSTTGTLPAYTEDRPLDLLKVTQSYTPEVQWVGGRVAAVGVNRGGVARLDSSLVWLRLADADDIGSFVTVGQDADADVIQQLGGVPADSLEDGETYTFWIAGRSAYDAGLDSTAFPAGAFADTTLTMELNLSGRSGGDRDLDVEFRVVQDERLTGNRYVLSWTPDIAFQRIALRSASTGGFTDLIWHVVVPDGTSGEIRSPVVIGETPAGAEEAIAFPETGFEPTVYTLWAVTDAWTLNDFRPSATGYAFFQIFPTNF